MIGNKSLGAGVFLISLKLKLNSFPKPGTFLHIKPWSGGTDPLLRRAFSIFDYDEQSGIVDVLYKVFGRGSFLLSKVSAGEIIDVLGPLGNGFEQPDKEAQLILTAGGVGLPPLYLLAKSSLMNGFKPKQITFLCGFGSADDIGIATRVETLPVKLRYATDDGSLGFHGFVTELLQQEIGLAPQKGNVHVCACGPEGMLKATQQIALQDGIRCSLSLESIMPCGVGTCLGCVVKKTGEEKYHRVCREGPVFDAREVEL